MVEEGRWWEQLGFVDVRIVARVAEGVGQRIIAITRAKRHLRVESIVIGVERGVVRIDSVEVECLTVERKVFVVVDRGRNAVQLESDAG